VPDTAGVKVLVYHRVDRHPGRKLRAWGMTPEAFLAQMSSIAEGGYEVLSLEEVLQVVRGERPSSRKAVALTFDDGYQDLLEHAVPVLRRFGFPATFFLVSERVGGTNSWDDRHGDPPSRLMGWNDAAALAAQGMEIGSHSRTHPFLTNLSESEMDREIRGSKEVIEDRLGRPVRFFSYPHGLHDERCRRLVASAGYSGACSTRFGVNGVHTDPFQLRRSEITFYDTAWSFSFKARTGFGVRAWATERLGGLLPRFVTGPRRVAS
jgi:peptidoglycan/xylan/chitin deacetylase (PgdA/CDA1 family)